MRPVMVLAGDPRLIAAAREAARRVRRSPVLVMHSGREVLACLVGPDPSGGHLVCDPAAAGASWPHLLRTFAEPSTRTALVLVGTGREVLPAGVQAIASGPGGLQAALRTPAPARGRTGLPRDAAAALRRALGRGDILVSYQPVVSLVDRRPLLVEALARWPHRRRLIDPADFVPLAERSGLAAALAAAVVARIAREAAEVARQLPLGVSLNLPLELVLRPELPTGLRRGFAGSGLRPARLAIELTETAPAHDAGQVRRALLRLRRAGHRVLLDDVLLDDPRRKLFALPFAGLKLDRSVTEAVVAGFRARRAVRMLCRAAHARGQTVIAEGVADKRTWSVVRAMGVDAAQGWLVGRPVPAAALGLWRDGWRRGG